MRQKMSQQDPKLRVKNFDSVALGFSQEQAVREAKRCLQCKKPTCIDGCPVEIDIPRFIRHIAASNFEEAIEIIKEKNNLPAICGRVCPQETQCEKVCVLEKKGEPVAIGTLERFAADWELSQSAKRKAQRAKNIKNRSELGDKRKIAVVGSGPAGLTCAADLARMGYEGTVIFESLHIPGGVLTYGIPEFRLPKKIVQSEVDYVKSLGVAIETDMVIGKIVTIEELFQEGFEAIFIGSGAGLPRFLGIEGENLNRVYSANEFLTRVNLMKAYLFPQCDTPINVGEKVIVIGGGNVAMDSARVALRLGVKEVTIVYRRTEQEMPARREEIENTKAEGVKFHLLTTPKKMIGDRNNYVVGMECIKMKLGEPDESGRRRPLPIDGSEFILKADTVVVAIGQSPNPLIPHATPALKIGKDGIIVVDESTGETNIAGVFAGGDITTGADTVISAMGAGKRAARGIDQYLSERKPIVSRKKRRVESNE